jgi:photosystem II stability/assembly factor-like uncharacterized protein
MWPSYQRLRQYAGGHLETWGPITMTIDSNVLLGEITTIITTTQTSTASWISDATLVPDSLLREAQLLAPGTGWALQGSQLLWTPDSGKSWEVITPPNAEAILSVDFADILNGWVVALNPLGELSLRQTRDGGTTWQTMPLPFSSLEVGAVYLEWVDAQTGWLALQLVSGSSFSRGRLYATQDGGRTWEERSIPLGEPVQFSDARHGWVAGGPTGDEFYRTEDGGNHWLATNAQEYRQAMIAFEPASLPENALQTSWADAQNAWALTQTGSCAGEKTSAAATTDPWHCWQQTRLLVTEDGGQTWLEITP